MVAAARAAAVALPLPLPGFKRAPGPVFRPRPRPVPDPPRERDRPDGGLVRRVGAFAVALPDHHWLDRVVRGRVWIPLLGVLLAGIVAAQVEILKLGASNGRSLDQTTTLTNVNEQLRGSVAALSDDQRIERLGAAMGLVLPPPGAVGYLKAEHDGNVGGALANIHPPDSSAFVIMTAKNGALVTGPNASTLPPTAGAPLPSASPTSTSTPTSSGTSASTDTSTTSSSGTTTPTSTTSSTGSTSSTSTTSSQATTTATTPTTSPQTATAPTDTTSSQTAASGAAAIAPSSTQSSTGG